MHRIKIKGPAKFFMELIKRFWGWFIIFQSVLLRWYYNNTGYWRYYYHSRCLRPPRVMQAPMEPGVHTMSDELILQIPCNIFLAFKWISMMTSGQNISHYTTAKLSVHVWNHDLIWWQNKIDTQKHFRKTTITSSWTLSKTKIPITIVKAQMPSNQNQKSRTRDNKYIHSSKSNWEQDCFLQREAKVCAGDALVHAVITAAGKAVWVFVSGGLYPNEKTPLSYQKSI